METFLAAAAMVFIAELGDKTQIVALGMGARYPVRQVIAGMIPAYAAVNLVSVGLGGAIGNSVSPRVTGVVAGLMFLAFGAWSWLAPEESDEVGGEDGEDGEAILSSAPSAPSAPSALSDAGRAGHAGGLRTVVLPVASALFVAELGDKTMLASGALATQGDPAWVWAGATVGLSASGVLAVAAGTLLANRITPAVTRIASTALFVLFGLALLALSV